MTSERVQVPVAEEYATANPTSALLHGKQARHVPSGITHLARTFDPFPLFVARCVASRKWDVDGHEYVDYWMGHGANLLGHGHPAVLEAVAAQIAKGFHAGGETEQGLEWAQLVCELVPSAERVRFTSSGGEATQMAMRLARATLGKDRIVKFTYNFHGWHDPVMTGLAPPFEIPISPGIPQGIRDTIVLAPFNDLDGTRRILDAHSDIAGVILEPGGAYGDTIPSDPAFLRGLRAATEEREVALIFDEVVTGFRYARGGAQEHFGVIPDLTALGKIVGGGVAAGAVAGSVRFMQRLEHRDDPDWVRFGMVPHPGTWNANPLAAAAGVATLRMVRTGKPVNRAAAQATRLRTRLNEVFAREGVPGVAYGRSSILRIHLGDVPKLALGDFSEHQSDGARLIQGPGPVGDRFRMAMLLEGIDLMRTNGFVSAVHSDDDVDATVRALQAALRRLKEERLI
jgi:glutamate-1-semialdehyde 2,1-aminomutase